MNSWFDPFGVRVSRFSIQKSSLFSVLFVLLTWSIRVNFVCLLRLWPSCLKCMDVQIGFGLLPIASFRWLFSRILKGASPFPTYCILERVFFRKGVIYQINFEALYIYINKNLSINIYVTTYLFPAYFIMIYYY